MAFSLSKGSRCFKNFLLIVHARADPAPIEHPTHWKLNVPAPVPVPIERVLYGVFMGSVAFLSHAIKQHLALKIG